MRATITPRRALELRMIHPTAADSRTHGRCAAINQSDVYEVLDAGAIALRVDLVRCRRPRHGDIEGFPLCWRHEDDARWFLRNCMAVTV